jgi:hypothetical protein
MEGIINEPIAATVAGPDPEMAEKNIQATIVTIASPPNTKPINASAKFKRRFDIPPSPINNPAKIKKGIAINGKESKDVNAFCTYVKNGILSLKKTITNNVDKPIDIPIGTLKKIKVNKTANNKIIVISWFHLPIHCP